MREGPGDRAKRKTNSLGRWHAGSSPFGTGHRASAIITHNDIETQGNTGMPPKGKGLKEGR